MTKIEIDESTFDFGVITSNDTILHDFYVKNCTSTLLVISEVLPSCKCTKASIEKKKVKQNDSTKVSVRFVPKSNQIGEVSSVVYLQCNAEKGIVKLNLKGENK